LDRAEAALGLFINSLEVLSGPWGVKTRLVPIDEGERRILRQSFEDRGLGFSTSNFDLAALMAAKASRNRRFAYSLALYAVSSHNHVNDPMLFDPAGDKYQARSKSHKDQVRFAYAIIAAFAVIEQLKLTPEKKSFHNGEWIPEKRQALESKLKNAGIDLTELVVWHIRGGKTRLELDRPPKIVKMCPWSSHQIRDCEIEMADAIADLRALRSQVAAHDLKHQAKNLSVHDVANAQLVARRLILESMGFSDKYIDQVIAARRLPKMQRQRWPDRAEVFRSLRKKRSVIQL